MHSPLLCVTVSCPCQVIPFCCHCWIEPEFLCLYKSVPSNCCHSAVGTGSHFSFMEKCQGGYTSASHWNVCTPIHRVPVLYCEPQFTSLCSQLVSRQWLAASRLGTPSQCVLLVSFFFSPNSLRTVSVNAWSSFQSAVQSAKCVFVCCLPLSSFPMCV